MQRVTFAHFQPCYARSSHEDEAEQASLATNDNFSAYRARKADEIFFDLPSVATTDNVNPCSTEVCFNSHASDFAEIRNTLCIT